MDTHLKERLVGAAVLVAVAVILIPEMLSGPAERPQVAPSEDATAGTGVRTYTIDLAGRPRETDDPAPPGAAVETETAAPPPEEVVELPERSPPPAAAEIPHPVEVAESPARQTASPVAVSPAPRVQTAPPTPSAGGALPWAVQVGSFAKQETAERLGQDLRKRGYTVYVVPFNNGAQTLYRVRIGPVADRKAADAIVQKLKAEGTVATVVSHS